MSHVAGDSLCFVPPSPKCCDHRWHHGQLPCDFLSWKNRRRLFSSAINLYWIVIFVLVWKDNGYIYIYIYPMIISYNIDLLKINIRYSWSCTFIFFVTLLPLKLFMNMFVSWSLSFAWAHSLSLTAAALVSRTRLAYIYWMNDSHNLCGGRKNVYAPCICVCVLRVAWRAEWHSQMRMWEEKQHLRCFGGRISQRLTRKRNFDWHEQDALSQP